MALPLFSSRVHNINVQKMLRYSTELSSPEPLRAAPFYLFDVKTGLANPGGIEASLGPGAL
jgi:hypothetical protein